MSAMTSAPGSNGRLPGEIFYIPDAVAPAGTEIPIQVHAYKWDMLLISSGAGIEAPPGRSGEVWDIVDLPVREVRFSVNGASIGTVPSRDDHTYPIPWNATGTPVGDHVIRADVVADDTCIQTITREIRIERGAPELELTRRVWREENAFRIELTVRNAGTVSYFCDMIRDNVDGLQGDRGNTGFPLCPDLAWPSTAGSAPSISICSSRARATWSRFGPAGRFRQITWRFRSSSPAPARLATPSARTPCALPLSSLRSRGCSPVRVFGPRAAERLAERDHLRDRVLRLPDRDESGEMPVRVRNGRGRCILADGRIGLPSQGHSRLSHGRRFRRSRLAARLDSHSGGVSMEGSDGVADHYLSNGYLLLVGEIEILPAWTVDITDITWSSDNYQRRRRVLRSALRRHAGRGQHPGADYGPDHRRR